MIRPVSHRKPIHRRLPMLIGACLALVALSGCCTVDCCKSSKCADVTKCSAPGERTLMVVKSRLDGCPDYWMKKMAVMKGDVVNVVNCSGQKAKVTFTPANFFVEGGSFEISDSQTLKLTVSSSVSINDVMSAIIEGEGSCSHGGGQVIVMDGP